MSVERLTSREPGGKAVFRIIDDDFNYIKLQDVAERLANYEDTDMDPSEVNIIKKHLLNLLDFANEGKIILLPCKKGDKLYVLTDNSRYGIKETKCKKIELINYKGNEIVRVQTKPVYDRYLRRFSRFYAEDFVSTVFLTCEEAVDAIFNKNKYSKPLENFLDTEAE